LVFGSADKTPIWLVEDGDTLYIDRNGDGDLTEAGKAIGPREDHHGAAGIDANGRPVPFRELSYWIGNIGPAGRGQHARFELTRFQQGADPPTYVLSGLVNGTSKEYAGWGLMLASSPDRAPILHFGGLLLAEAFSLDHLKIGKPEQELFVRLYTPGVGPNSTVSLGHDAVPANVQPTAEIVWPGGSVPTKSVVTLSERC
jgi:hypothetical protein